MTSRIKLLLLFMAIPSAVIIILTILAARQNNKPNGFNRNILQNAVFQDEILDVTYNSYYLAGIDNGAIYLANYKAPLLLLHAGTTLRDTQFIYKKMASLEKARVTHMAIDSPWLYITNEETNQVFRSAPEHNQVTVFRKDSSFFSDIIPLSPSTAVLRTMLEKERQAVLVKESMDGNGNRVLATDILTAQGDGWFSTDGILQYNQRLHLLVYVYFYRNQFICIDTNLQLISKGRTIDTFAHPVIQSGHINSDNSTMIIASHDIINKKACVFNHLLFVNSAVKADNDNEKEFREASAIDVYALPTGKYQYSFYIPKYQHKTLRDFKIYGNKIACLYERTLVTYQFNPRYHASLIQE